MSIVELERQPQGDAGPNGGDPATDGGSRGAVRSFESAARALLGELWGGSLTATTPEDRWLVGRMEEALAGLDEIRAMSPRADTSRPAEVVDGGTASILAPRVGAS